MKKKITIGAIMVLCATQGLYAQNPGIEKESWVAKPVIFTPDSKYSKESAVIIYDKRRMEYIDISKDEITAYYTLHKIIHINDDRGIESFNKIYLGIGESQDVVDVKARTVLPGGKIIQLDKSNIKDIQDKDGSTYKIFAMDGLEKGCDVEYFYTYKRPTGFFGKEIVQTSIPVLEASVQIVAPKRLKFDTKSYNCELSPIDTVINDKRIIQCNFKEIQGIGEEKYAYDDANFKRVEYKLSYNESVNKGERLNTWNGLAKRIYGVYTYYTDREKKAIADMVIKNGWATTEGEAAKIMSVENYIKKNISYDEDVKSEEGNMLAKVIQTKSAGMVGIMRLYSAIFENLGVKYQFVLTGDREKYFIDRQFENWNNCDYPVFYFPAENKFMAPTRPDYRYPWIVPQWGATNALFCKPASLGNFSTAIAEIKNIPLEDYTQSIENIEAKLQLTGTLDSLTIDEKQIFAGYEAPPMRDAFNFSNDEQKKELFKAIAKQFTGSDNVISSEVLNKEFENENTNRPLIVHTITRSGEFIEKAGDKLLVKIGMAIGPQVEMYQDKPRQQPVNLDFGHVEERKIELTIPDGYTIKNLNDIKMSQTFKDGDDQTMGFVSDYELKDNVLTVHIMEEYQKTFYPLAQFDQFRKIINASSDFNKVVLVLEKKTT
ncbi:DUF3857 domain-containing protein [Mucilaginibacter sp. L3T2-6]|uniref:DUF3857 domain-containing protein n=1 Tax=Mucilaginibacter sp. L3T2-6 TaxID=3062491 RepID=UPI0026761D1F|nr:DUF3857 domain-containing protein [Mucilaginibacter sp. L3T2-6]MDO3643242.1 DUF3857 domain-containing protein [Mucilaginibacter sp. L3T2-6]MDV6215566.1 DUF3857 domain-containing protein [Mucilaginibacter sp. L3T2-6]